MLTLEQYKSFFVTPTDGTWNVNHMGAFVFTIVTSVLVTALNFAICYPLAYYMAQAGTAQKVRLIMLALIVPYWVNEILRAFSLRLLLASKGLINQALMGMGLTDKPLDFLAMDVGLYVGLSYAYLLVMIFPLYNAIESLDKNQIEAARDLGAPWWKIHRDVVIPYAKPGIASGCTMVFMLAAGSLAAPQFLGGPSTLWFTSIVYDFFFQAFNWPRGAAYAFILLAACIAFVMLMLQAVQGLARGDDQVSSKTVMKGDDRLLHRPLLPLSLRAADGDERHRLQHAQLSRPPIPSRASRSTGSSSCGTTAP